MSSSAVLLYGTAYQTVDRDSLEWGEGEGAEFSRITRNTASVSQSESKIYEGRSKENLNFFFCTRQFSAKRFYTAVIYQYGPR
jgi:hypothetical protein